MATAAKKAFDSNILRARYFLDVHEATQPGQGAPTKPRRELPRGAIVFAVGAIDAYLCEISAEVLLTQVAGATATAPLRDVLGRVQKEVPALALEVALLDTEAARRSRIHDAIVEYFQNQTSQFGAKAVSGTVARLGGNAGDVWSVLIQEGYSEPQKLLDDWTDVRHQIVHQGKTPRVRREDARDFVTFSKALIQRLDVVATSLAS